MKRYLIIFILIFFSSLSGSCVSFKIKSPPPPENQVESIHLCKKIDDSGDLLKPLDIQTEFSSQDDGFICFIKLNDITTKIQLRWRWYSPDKKMVRDTGNVMLNSDERYLETVTAYDKLQLNHKNDIEGEWTVVVLINDKFIGRKEFRLNPSNKD